MAAGDFNSGLTLYVCGVYIRCMAKIHLKHQDREFLSLVLDAAFANPFSRHRIEIDTINVEQPTAPQAQTSEHVPEASEDGEAEFDDEP